MTNKNFIVIGSACAFVVVMLLLMVKMITDIPAQRIDQQVKEKAIEQFYDFKEYRVGKNVLPPITFYDPHNQKISTDIFKGKYLFLNMWATWCPGCVNELPSLEKLSHYFSAKEYPVVVLAISLDRKKNMQEVAEFLFNHNVGPFALYHDTDKELARAYPVNGMPTTLLIDPDGNVIYEFMGEADWQEPNLLALLQAEIHPYYESLINQNSP